VGVLLGPSLALRVWASASARRSSIFWDEPNGAVRLGSGDLHPHYFYSSIDPRV